LEGNRLDDVLSSDLVIGMTTVLLVEACYLHCIVLSLQPELKQKDSLPTNAIGVSQGVYKTSDILPTLEKYLLNTLIRKTQLEKIKKMMPDHRASQCLTDYIYSYINERKMTGSSYAM
jgi:hypothetical protein